MQTRPFGSTTRAVPLIGQGTWMIEGGGARRRHRRAARGLDLGMTHIDTAEMYGSGASEEIVAEAIAGRRDEVFLVSKVLPENASPRRHAGRLRALARAVSGPTGSTATCCIGAARHPLAETIAAFEELQRDGKILSWGVSNFDVDDLEEAHAHRRHGRIACNQVLYHLRERAIEHAVIPWCERHGVAVVGYSPFGHGPLPRPAHGRRPGARRDRRRAWRDAAPGGARLPDVPAARVFAIPKALERRARRGQCRRRRPRL